MVQSPVMTPPTWSQVPARAMGPFATINANSPPRTRVETINRLTAAPFRPARLNIERPPGVEASERIRRATTGGHVARAIPARFINRLPRDYLWRYGPVLMRANNSVL